MARRQPRGRALRRASKKRVRTLPASAPPPPRAAGFDCGSYPGDAALSAWAETSPYAFVGYYLDAPCHTKSSFTAWSGKFALVKSLGLGVAVVYVGFQQDGCGQSELSRASGVNHAKDTIAQCSTEGFPTGTTVFLDVEHFDGALSAGMTAYLQGWIGALLDDGSVRPGVYCPARKAAAIRALAALEYEARGLDDDAPAFWIVKIDKTFDTSVSVPAGCGVAFARVWQGRIDVLNETHGGVAITIDQNVADRRDPSGALG